MTYTNLLKADGFELNHTGWKYYNKIKKKAMEQEFSLSGLVLSLSIAFFIVISSAFFLSLVNRSFEQAKLKEMRESNIYQLESNNEYLQSNLDINKILSLSLLS